jgi:3-hydroxyisobutyrate dehydrogenase
VRPIKRVAFLGMGIMGSRMAAQVAQAGFELAVWNRTRERAEAVAEATGARLADTPADAADGADATITMVVDAAQVEAVLLGENGAAAAMAEGSLVIDSTTIAPASSRDLAGRLSEMGIGFLDAPVSGSTPKAETGTLTIMVGGSDEDFAHGLPLLEAMGELIVHMGPQGQGSLVKLLNNTMSAVNAAALAESVTIAKAGQLDLDAFLQVVSASSGDSLMLRIKTRPMAEHDFSPFFRLDHLLKDVRLFVDTADEFGTKIEVSQAARALFEQASANGLGDVDFSAVIEVVEDQ